jgi:hypothetical protein
MPWTLSVDKGAAEADVDDGSSMVVQVLLEYDGRKHNEFENCETPLDFAIRGFEREVLLVTSEMESRIKIE